MGRVDEAMRRAAKAVAEPEDTGGRTPAGAAGDRTADLFPTEGGDRPRLRSVTPVGVDAADSRVASPAAAAVPTVPVIHRRRVGGTLPSKTVVDQETDPVSKEQYRRLATALYSTQGERELRVVMVASAVPGEGKSLTAANLALTFSESYQKRVLLIDGDLRRPTLHTVFGIDETPGLTDGLLGSGQGLTLHQVSATLTVISAGHPTDDPMAVLASDQMRQLIDEARERYDWVVVDTPPVGLLADANLVVGMTDGAVLVVRAQSTDYETVQRAVAMLGPERVLGVVLNRADATHAGQYDYRSYYSAQPRTAARTGAAPDR